METILLPFLIALAILIALFLLLREIMLWYWKINRSIELMERTNNLLELIYVQLGGTFNISINKSINITANMELLPDEIKSFLSEDEKIYIKTSIKKKRKQSGEMIIINKETRVIERIYETTWIKISNNGKGDEYLIIMDVDK